MNLNPLQPIRGKAPPTLGPSRIVWSSLAIAVIAVLSCFILGWLAYTTSRRVALDTAAQANLSISRTIVNLVEHDLVAANAAGTNQADPKTSIQQQALERIAAIWSRTDPSYAGSYVCVIESSGELALHTKNPAMCGKNVSQVIVDPDTSRSRTVAELLKSKQSLATHSVNFLGKPQLAGYSYMPSIDSLVVVHVPSQLVEDNIRKAAIPWMVALALVAGVLIPLAVGLIHHGYLNSQTMARQTSETLIASEQRMQREFAELELIYRTAPAGLGLVDVDLRFVRVNDMLAAIDDLPAELHIGRSLRDVVPDLADFLEPICQRVIETGQPELNMDIERTDPNNPSDRLSFLVSYFPVKAENGRVLGVSAVVQDITDKRHAERELLIRQQAIARSSMPTWFGDDQYRVTYVNQAFLDLFGFDAPEQVIGKPNSIFVSHPTSVGEINAVMTATGSWTGEVTSRKCDGSAVDLFICASMLRDEAGTPVCSMATFWDVTERKSVELALRESEDLFRRLVDVASFGVQRNDVDGKITFANEALGEIYGVSAEEMIGKYVWEFAIDDPTRQAMREYVRQQTSQTPEQPTGIETKNLTCDGRIIDVFINWTFDLDAAGNVVGFIVVVADITERKQVERTLAFQAEVLNRVSDAVLVSDSEGLVTYANEAAEQLFRAANVKYSGRKISELHDESIVSGPTSRDICAGLAAAGTWQGENDFEIGDETRSFEMRLQIFQASGRDDRLMVSVVRDISLRKKAEQERGQHRDILAHMTRLSTMGEMVAGIAHEVRQPLHAVSNYANAALSSLNKVDPIRPLTSDQMRDLKECNVGIRDASKRANEILRGLRAFAEKSEQRRERINLNQVVADSVELVAFEARKSQATVEIELSEGLPGLIADRIQIEQVVVNLLHNAYEALRNSDPPRRVVVRTSQGIASQGTGYLEVQVEDNGPGVPSEQHGRLYEAFYSTKRNGMGMGLTISRTIIEDHGGRLWARNKQGRGVTFHFSLPVDAAGVDHSRE